MYPKKLTCSVAMATYNGEKYVVEQLKSIEKQTILPDEVVIFDDVSKDNTVAVIEEFAKTSKLNIKLNVNKTNLGFRKNYEKIYANCIYDLIFLCDQDDVWFENKIETFLNEFENDENLVYAFSNAYVTDEHLNIIRDSEWSIDWTKFNRQEFFDYTQTRNFPLGFQAVARRSFVNEIMPLMADPDGWIAECAAVFGTVKAIPEKLVYYRRHSQATSNAYKNSRKSYLSYIKRMFSTKYQKYFVYPNAELDTYGCILEYARKTHGVQTNEIEKHIVYLETLKNIEKKNFLVRAKALRKLKKDNLYSVYRGNDKTYILDLLFLFVNSFKPINKR